MESDDRSAWDLRDLEDLPVELEEEDSWDSCLPLTAELLVSEDQDLECDWSVWALRDLEDWLFAEEEDEYPDSWDRSCLPLTATFFKNQHIGKY